jgi:phosphoheptose isomerase/phosphoglycolate phosphatase-like HAD superfamily hydrolase
LNITKIQESLKQYAGFVLSEAVKSDWNALALIVDELLQLKKRNGRIFTAGNGGSHATASHMANDFIKGCRVHNRVGFDVECLGDANAIITCLANDFSYDEIYSIPLRTKAKAGDALVYFSGSGNSPNLITAAKTAREMGVTTIGFLGRDGGALKELSDLYIIAPSDSMERIEDLHMMYEHNMVCAIRSILEDEWGMEIINYPPRKADFKFALFDFDGTLSLIREGWREIMIPYFIEVLLQTPKAEDNKTIEEIVTLFVDRLTGKQTIFQCIRLDEEVVARGGNTCAPGVYKAEYLRRLGIHIKNRLNELREGKDPEKYLVPGSVKLLELLRENGYSLFLASGTDEPNVLEEAKLLGIDKYFDGHINGARDDMTDCSKEMVIKKIISDYKLTGSELVAFGDAYVEIELVAGIGGYTVGAATDEVRLKGINMVKRERMLEAGADLIIPDFSEAETLVEFLKGDNR